MTATAPFHKVEWMLIKIMMIIVVPNQGIPNVLLQRWRVITRHLALNVSDSWQGMRH